MIMMTVFDWQFRVLRNGSFQSRNEKQGLDWDIRQASDVGLDSGRYWYIKNTIEQVAMAFPEAPVPPPSTESLDVQQQSLREKIVASENQPV